LREVVRPLISFTAVGRSIAKAHTVLEQYYQPLVQQKRSDPGTAEEHRDALIGELDYAELGAEASAQCGRMM